MKLDTVVAYTYRADIYCPRCAMIKVHLDRGRSLPALDVLPTEARMERLADLLEINWRDETTFDSGDFPKVIFAEQVNRCERCANCSEHLRG